MSAIASKVIVDEREGRRGCFIGSAQETKGTIQPPLSQHSNLRDMSASPDTIGQILCIKRKSGKLVHLRTGFSRRRICIAHSVFLLCSLELFLTTKAVNIPRISY